MKSKTSFFNKTIFRKNFTRFAPVWVVYTICLVVGLAMVYTNYSGERRLFWFAANLAQDLPQFLSIVNLLYAPLVAQLLFGDLYNSRMCNAIHALPMGREEYYLTNALSGVAFSVGPTLVMCLLSLPLLAGSVFENAWQIPFLLLAISTLEFLCFFGMAVFCCMVVGNRFTMLAGYGLLNAGAYIAYWVVNTLYTPMLYGVVTPTRLSENLTPIAHMLEALFVDCTPFSRLHDVMEASKVELSELTAQFTLTEAWGTLALCAGAGLLFLGVGLALYRIRHLECAGDAVAFPILVPVFQVLCAMFVMVGAQFFLDTFLGVRLGTFTLYLTLGAGLVVGWFIGKMLLERSTRVFRLRNFCGLGALALVLALSLVATNFDILGIETRLPQAEQVEKVYLNSSYNGSCELTEEGEIADALRIHALALENRPEEGEGFYVRGYDGSFVRVVDTNEGLYDPSVEKPEFTYVTGIRLYYVLKNGNTVQRNYSIWMESEEGDMVRRCLSRWETINELRPYGENREQMPVLDQILENLDYMRVETDYDYVEKRDKITDKEEVRSFLEAVKKDCEAGTMAQDNRFHKAIFRAKTPTVDEDGKQFYRTTGAVYIYFRSESEGYNLRIYPDCEHSLRWLLERNHLNMEILENTSEHWTAKTQP